MSSLSSFHICPETQTDLATLERWHLLDIYYTGLAKHLAWVPMITHQSGAIFYFIWEKRKLSETFFPTGKEKKQTYKRWMHIVGLWSLSSSASCWHWKAMLWAQGTWLRQQKLSSGWKRCPHGSGQATAVTTEQKLNREGILLGYPYTPTGLLKMTTCYEDSHIYVTSFQKHGGLCSSIDVPHKHHRLTSSANVRVWTSAELPMRSSQGIWKEDAVL